MPKNSPGLKKYISRFLLLPGIIGILLLPQLYSCKEDESLPPLEIYSVEPAVAAIGDTIRIIGQGFSPGFLYNRISFAGGAAIDAMPGSNTEQLLVQVADGALSGPITVNILDVETAQSPPVEILVPEISQVNPTEAWVGDTIVIQGRNFQMNKQRNHVKIGTSNWANVTAATKTALKVVVPQDASHGPVSVLGFEGPAFKVKPSVVDAVVPGHGIVGDTLVIQGKGMNVSHVQFAPATLGTLLVEKSDPRNVYVVVPPGAVDGPLKVTCRISDEDIIVESPKPFLVYPSIREFSPLSGSAGVPVTISGYNFSAVAADNIVSFNGTPATVTEASATSLKVSVPSGFTTGPVSVTVNGRTATGPVFSVAEPGAPIIYSVSPRSGPAGSRVLITGTNFGTSAGANTVKFAGNATATVVSATPTQLVVEVPAGAQSGQITVTKEGKTGVGSSFTVTADLVSFISSVEPASAAKGATITVKGGNFNSAASGFSLQSEGGIAYAFEILSATGSQITARVPGILELGDHMLYVVHSGKLSNGAHFEVAGTPSITSLDISEGAPGAILTITGSQLNPAETKNIVKFGTEQATWVNPGDQDPNTVAVYIPGISAGTYHVTITAFGTVSNSVAFHVKASRVAVRNILYTENAPPRFSLKRRTSDPPSESTIFSKSFANMPMNVVTLDMPRSKAYFMNEDGNTLARVNFDQSGYEALYTSAVTAGAVSFIDMTLDTDHQKIFFCDIFGFLYAGSLDGTAPPEVLFDYTTNNIAAVGISYAAGDNSLYIISNYTAAGVPPTIQRGAVDTRTLTELFNDSDGLVNPYDVKPDFAAQKLFVLDDLRAIRTGNLDGSGSLSTLVTRSNDMVGMAIDPQNQFVYWMEFADAAKTQASVFRVKYDLSTIPGTDPPAAIEVVYTGISASVPGADPFAGGMVAGLALEDEAGGASSMRSAGSFSAIKTRMLPRKLSIRKKARPGE